MIADVQLTGDATPGVEARSPATLQVTQPSGRAVVLFSYKNGALDLSNFRELAVRIANGSSAELDVLIRVESKPDGTSRGSTTGRFLVRPGEENTLTTLLPRKPLPADHPHVKTMGRLFAFPWGHQRHWLTIDPSSIMQARVQISWRKAEEGQTIQVGLPCGSGDFSTDPKLLENFHFPMVDEFGQASWMEWEGKIHTAEELPEDGRKDLSFAATVSGFGDQRSRFGGWNGGPKREATGFFRVEKIDGTWWFVDPEGNLFWSLGVNSTGLGAETSVQGREHLFPESLRGEPKIRLYENNLQRKYGAKDWRKKHTDVTVARMRDWGMNTVGAWSSADMGLTQRVPYTLILHPGTQGMGAIAKMADPFSKSFADSLEHSLAKLAADHAQSPWLVGIFLDNELDWGNGNALFHQIANSPGHSPARMALVDFLRKRHRDIAGLNQAWDTNFADFAALKAQNGPAGGKAYQQDINDFLAVFADKYFTVCRAAMDKHFPHHLYLGCRFHVLNPIVTRAASRHCDVISVNVYQHTLEGYSVPMDEDRPWIISEFHFGMRDRGNLGTGLTWAADGRNQADLVTAYLSEALRHPNFVGAHWFEWSDQAVTGRYDGENFGVGLVTVVDRPVETLTEAMSKISEFLPASRFGGGEPTEETRAFDQ